MKTKMIAMLVKTKPSVTGCAKSGIYYLCTTFAEALFICRLEFPASWTFRFSRFYDYKLIAVYTKVT